MAHGALEELTPREHEVLELLLERLSTKEIAERLTISNRTVEVHVSHILAKFGVASRRELRLVAKNK